MRLPIEKIFFLFWLLIFSGTALCAENPDMYTSARALGMGNAYIAVANNADALFYNPAGLARNSGIDLKLFGVGVGVGGLESITELQNLNGSSGSGFVSALGGLMGKNTWIGAGGKAAFTMPYFGFAVYDVADVGLVYQNPVYPQFDTNAVNDYGYTAGVGLPIAPFLHWGMSLKYIKRYGTRDPISTSTLANLDFSSLESKFTQWGRGYGMDMGLNFTLPTGLIRPVFSTVWRNIGDTSFRSDDPNTHLPIERSEVAVGAALLVDLPLVSVSPAIDIRYLNRDDLQITRKINFGVEVDLPLIDVRAGFREGYYTAGVGVNLGLIRVDAATYGVELGVYPGQMEDRRYMVELSMDLGFDFSTAGNSGGRSGSKGSGGSGSKNSQSIFGGRKLKQRR